MDDRFALATITKHRADDGMFMAWVWDKEMQASTTGRGRMRASAKANAFSNAKAKADAAQEQVARFFALNTKDKEGAE